MRLCDQERIKKDAEAGRSLEKSWGLLDGFHVAVMAFRTGLTAGIFTLKLLEQAVHKKAVYFNSFNALL